MASTELRLAIAPTGTYAGLVDERASGYWPALAGSLSLIVAAYATGVTLGATQQVSLELVATIGASWGFVLVIQTVAALCLVASSKAREVDVLRAVELLFLAHLPWSLWFLVAPPLAAWFPAMPLPDGWLQASVTIPALWTMVLLAAFCRTVLRTTRSGAVVRVVMHQAIVWGLALGYLSYAAGGWRRIVESAAR